MASTSRKYRFHYFDQLFHSRNVLVDWIVFGAFTLFDSLTSFILDLIPFYYMLKLIFLVYLMFPPDQAVSRADVCFYIEYSSLLLFHFDFGKAVTKGHRVRFLDKELFGCAGNTQMAYFQHSPPVA